MSGLAIPTAIMTTITEVKIEAHASQANQYGQDCKLEAESAGLNSQKQESMATFFSVLGRPNTKHIIIPKTANATVHMEWSV
jgi:hypothetical protein